MHLLYFVQFRIALFETALKAANEKSILYLNANPLLKKFYKSYGFFGVHRSNQTKKQKKSYR